MTILSKRFGVKHMKTGGYVPTEFFFKSKLYLTEKNKIVSISSF